MWPSHVRLQTRQIRKLLPIMNRFAREGDEEALEEVAKELERIACGIVAELQTEGLWAGTRIGDSYAAGDFGTAE